MKLPYRAGDSFDLPLGTGESTPATIVACHHHFVEIAVADCILRVFDGALALHRWQTRRAEHKLGKVQKCHPEPSRRTLTPPRAERMISALLGVAAFDESTFAVYEMHDDISLANLESMPSGALLTWSEPLAESTIERLGEVVASRSDLRLRLHGAAASQAARFNELAIQELTLAGEGALEAPFPHVTQLTIDAPIDQATLAEIFPNLRLLRISAGAKRVDLGAVARLTNLEHLDISHVTAADETLEHLAPLATLRALRVARLDGVRLLQGLDALLNVQTLNIENLQLDSLAPLPLMASLEQLELHGMWQFTIDDVAWLHDLPRIVRAEIDIGGRRKNLELYRRARWAYPWPTF